MKSFALFLVLPMAIISQAQSPASPPDPPDVVVLKFAWSKERIGWERDPFGGAIENFDEVRARTRNEKRIEDAKRGGNSADLDRIKREAQADAANIAAGRRKAPPRYAFMYKVSIKNTGIKAIRTIDWDYIFLDSNTRNEIGRHQFTSEGKIGPGKSRELNIFTPKPPTGIVSVYELNSKERLTLNERVMLMRIQYSDGSVWQRP